MKKGEKWKLHSSSNLKSLKFDIKELRNPDVILWALHQQPQLNRERLLALSGQLERSETPYHSQDDSYIEVYPRVCMSAKCTFLNNTCFNFWQTYISNTQFFLKVLIINGLNGVHEGLNGLNEGMNRLRGWMSWMSWMRSYISYITSSWTTYIL